jgi:hypothetical protein
VSRSEEYSSRCIVPITSLSLTIIKPFFFFIFLSIAPLVTNDYNKSVMRQNIIKLKKVKGKKDVKMLLDNL